MKSNMVSPFSLHQQQLAMMAQQQSLLMAAAAKSGGGAMQPGSNGTNVSGASLPTQNWPNLGYYIPGMKMPAGGKNELQKFMQMGNATPTQTSGISIPFSMPSMYNTMGGPVAPTNGISNSEASRPTTDSPIASVSPPTRSGKDFDFSSLTQGMFSKP